MFGKTEPLADYPKLSNHGTLLSEEFFIVPEASEEPGTYGDFLDKGKKFKTFQEAYNNVGPTSLGIWRVTFQRLGYSMELLKEIESKRTP